MQTIENVEKLKNWESQNHTQKFLVVGRPTHTTNCHCDTFMDKTYTAALIMLLRKKEMLVFLATDML